MLRSHLVLILACLGCIVLDVLYFWSVFMTDPAEREAVCPSCKGGGLIWERMMMTTAQCPTCNGTGRVPAQEQEKE
jgi:hypothetical protein